MSSLLRPSSHSYHIQPGIIRSWIATTELEFLKGLWELGTEKEKGYRTGPKGYIAGGIHSLESIPGPRKHLKVRALSCLQRSASHFWQIANLI
jgi:hypothetical protein